MDIANKVIGSTTLLPEIETLRAGGMGNIFIEGDALVVEILVFRPPNTKESTKILKTLVNEGVVELNDPDKLKLMEVNLTAGNKSFWKEVLRC